MFKSINKRIRSLRSNKSSDPQDEDEDNTTTMDNDLNASMPAPKTAMAIREKELGHDTDLIMIRTFYARLGLKCHRCTTPLRVEDTNSHIETWLGDSQCIPPKRQVAEVACWKCSARTCVGCGYEPKLTRDNVFTPAGVINCCCTASRTYGIWLLLARFDDEEMRVKRSNVDASNKRGKIKTSKKSGVGYAGGAGYAQYHAYGGYPHSHTHTSPVTTSSEGGDVADDLVVETLQLLKGFLPVDSEKRDIFMATALFRMSMLLDRVAVLLRNDSIVDWTERRRLYFALLDFIKGLLQDSELSKMVFELRPGKNNSPGLRALTESSRFTFKVDDTSTSVFGCTENIYRQARVFLDLSKKSDDPTIGKESIKICQEVFSVYERMEKAAQAQPAGIDLKEPWIEFMEENRVTFTDEVLANHCFQKQYSVIHTTNIGRMSTIGKEIANMATSLPDGVFLKVADSRSDVMKVLIVGPEGGPYAGGLFIFDLFLDANYPISPPQMRFVLPTADDDGHNFNPNLHMGGTVCLSLLNTWNGMPDEMWQPNKSTILSVLISVQAMILGAPFPWANEPGREHAGDTSVSRTYNMLIQCKTVKGAMTFWLSDAFPKSTATIWKDVSEVYFRCNGQKALQGALDWSKQGNKGLSAFIPSYQTLRKKTKAKASTTPSPTPVNLLEQLAKHLGTTITEKDYAPVPSDDSRKRKAAGDNSDKSPKKPKKSEILAALTSTPDFEGMFADFHGQEAMDYYLEDMEGLDDDDYADMEEQMLGQFGFFHGTHTPAPNSLAENSGPRWVYTGIKNQKETRAACKEFGINHGKSIAATIEKMEKHVNGHGKLTAGSDTLKKWGSVVEESSSASGSK